MQYDRLSCCKLGEKSVKYRNVDTFKGPVVEGWSIIANVTIGTPEYENIDFCPFCGKKIEHFNKKEI